MNAEIPSQRVAAKAVIVAEGGILALYPSFIDRNRKWHLPGGIRDDIFEPLGQTALRETNQETGIDLSGIPNRLLTFDEWEAVDKDEPVRILALFFLFELSARPEVVLSEEHDGFAWLDLTNYTDHNLNIEARRIIELVLGSDYP